ncbi:MAG TPA: RidA family protein [Caulobacteraceae bacterium]|nr:RidA family protein [Caulobacteraceae bacterium]
MTSVAVMKVDPPGLFRAPHFSQAVVVETPARILFTAGQVGGDGFGAVTSTDFEAQAIEAFDHLELILTHAGMTMADVVKVTGYLTERKHLDAYRRLFLERLGAARPSSTVVIAELVDPRLLIEIEAVAAGAAV